MPKRSNDFQRLVKLIHDAIATIEGATVTESAMLSESDGTLREVDILLERRIADVQIRIAIECRDRSRKSDVDWIDGLIGKFRSLKVEKVIAVCRRGFSAAATTKANANNIELRTLEQSLKHEWKEEFLKLGFAAFEFTPQLRAVEIKFDPAPVEPIAVDILLDLPEGAPTRTVASVIQACFVEHVIPQIKAYIEKEFLSAGPALADLTRSWEFTVPVEVHDVWVVTDAKTRHQMTQLTFEVVARSVATPSEVQHFKYGSTALASVGALNFASSTHTMKVIQVAGHKQLTINVTENERNDD